MKNPTDAKTKEPIFEKAYGRWAAAKATLDVAIDNETALAAAKAEMAAVRELLRCKPFGTHQASAMGAVVADLARQNCQHDELSHLLVAMADSLTANLKEIAEHEAN